MRGYRGFLREFTRTGSLRALSLQLRVGAQHVARRALGRNGPDPEQLFLDNYRADGVRRPEPALRALQLSAQACLVCGLCSGACARAEGAPRLDPRDAVLAGARLAIDVRRLGLREVATACAACRDCESVCPARIPIASIQEALLSLGEEAP
jgi:formate hydrogenlyase subunit 6/NADH:ubiquinone oxidoreductase subunit I